MPNVTVSVHGTSFHVEDLSRVDRVTRFGWGLEVAAYRHGGYAGPAAWVHAPLPIPAAWQLAPLPPNRIIEIEERVRLTQVSIEFDSSASPYLYVRNLHVWNGSTRIANFDDLRERGPGLLRDFNPLLELEGWNGLNLSIGIEFPLAIDTVDRPPPAIIFKSASAFLTVERLF